MRIVVFTVCLFLSTAIIHEPSHAETVSRCDESMLKSESADSLKGLINKLKEDAFSEAFGVFVRDLEQLDRELRDLIDKGNTFLRTKCRPHNADADEYEKAVRTWETSRCVVGPITKEEVLGCRTREAELRSWQTRTQNSYTTLYHEAVQIDKELQDLNARSVNPIRNAENVLNPEYTEQALRLYTWYILHQTQRGSLKSCQGFSQIAEKLGRRVANQDLFINYLTRNFIEQSNAIHIIIGDPPFRPMAGSTFDASGFKRRFYDQSSENQVRHASAYLATGYKLGVGEAVLYSFRADVARRHPELGDFRLAMYAAHLGFRLRNGFLRTSNFGEAMRNALCE